MYYLFSVRPGSNASDIRFKTDFKQTTDRRLKLLYPNVDWNPVIKSPTSGDTPIEVNRFTSILLSAAVAVAVAGAGLDRFEVKSNLGGMEIERNG